MSFVSIRCPNCAAAESTPIGENRYQCKYCDNTFNYVDPNAPKITKNITIQEVQSHHCPICGRGVTAGTSNRCTSCGANDLCNNCIFETAGKKIACKTCLTANSDDCLTCGNGSPYKCVSCVKLHERDSFHTITRCCAKQEHFLYYFCRNGEGYSLCCWCDNCGSNDNQRICKDCMIGDLFLKCKSCRKRPRYKTYRTSELLQELEKSWKT